MIIRRWGSPYALWWWFPRPREFPPRASEGVCRGLLQPLLVTLEKWGESGEVSQSWRWTVVLLTFLKVAEWPVRMNECLFEASWILGGMSDPISSQHSDFLCSLAMCGCTPSHFRYPERLIGVKCTISTFKEKRAWLGQSMTWFLWLPGSFPVVQSAESWGYGIA